MPRTITRPFVSALLFVSLLLGLALAGFTQEETLPSPGTEAAGQEAPEVLTRGPVHEAFAEQINNDPDSGALVPNAPPEPIGEVPPEYKPEGENVLWIPGYWSWDDEREDYVWVSGVWRVPPTDRRWVPGYWHQQGEEGYYWISGFWISTTQDAVEYQQQPPRSIETGPTSAAPDKNHFWVPGCWNYNNTYRWRPGYWRPFRADWIWIPAHYVWTPRGSVFVDGYWDYRMPRRGQLFAPVYVRHHRHRHINYRYRPSCVINLGSIGMHLFIRPSYHHYYFGDYYGASYSSRRFYASFNFQSSGFGCDPFLTYYQWHFGRSGVNYTHRLRQSHSYFSRYQNQRPARTLRSQTNIVINQQNNTHVNINVLGRSLHDVARDKRSTQKLVRLANEQRTSHQRDLAEIRDFSQKRREHERAHVPGKTPGLAARAAADQLASTRAERAKSRPELTLPPVRKPTRPGDPRTRPRAGELAKELAESRNGVKRPTSRPARPAPEKKANGKVTRPAIVGKTPAPIVGPLPATKKPTGKTTLPATVPQVTKTTKAPPASTPAAEPVRPAITRPVPEKKANGRVTRPAIVNKTPAPIVGPLPATRKPTGKTTLPATVPQVTKTTKAPSVSTPAAEPVRPA
ncbi:MAG: BcpO-related WXXGXW repeat protein, partial [Planctomycetaceae bacterium]|nr:BcpO-related WXXGXW repeat protein [Planctomycetaceae bacterium]